MQVINPQKYGIIGSGSQADEIEFMARSSQCLFRAVDSSYIDKRATVDVSKPNDIDKQIPIIAALGSPKLKKDMIEKWPGKMYATLISSQAIVASDIKIGEGSVITQGTVITTNVAIGSHVLVNINTSISHDCVIGNFVTISPGVSIAGRVSLGDGVFVGIGATIINGVNVASGVVIGAGAVVTNDITIENSVVVGVPAKEIQVNKDWLENV